MALTKCPNCAQSVLSVASQCPKCFTEMNQTIALADRDVLADCRKCGRAVYSHISTCPHCGTSRPAIRRRGLLIAGMIVLVIVCLMLLAFLRQPAPDPLAIRAAIRPPRPVSAAGLRTVEGRLRVRPVDRSASRETTEARSPVSTDSAILRAREVLATVNRAANAVPVPTPKPAARTNPSLPVPAAEVKFVSTWANVRDDPTNDSQVVRVLRPGTQIAVVPQERGWWPVYENGRQVGYVARQLLVDQPAEQ